MKPWQVGEGELAAVDVHAAEFGAAVRLREDLAGVEDLGRIEGALDPLLLVQVVLVEHHRHEVALLDANPLLAGQHATSPNSLLVSRAKEAQSGWPSSYTGDPITSMFAGILVWLLLFVPSASLAAGAVIITDAIDEGVDCFKVSTETATYYYDKAGAGFTSVLDRNGIDWVDFHPKGTPAIETGSEGWYRGIPNMGYHDFGHPGYTGATSTTPDEHGVAVDRATINSTKGAWNVTWEFFPTHAAMTVHSAPGNYWLLYEGTPGGTFGPEDTCHTSDSVIDLCAAAWQGEIAGTAQTRPVREWIYFADRLLKRSIFLIHNDDELTDLYFPMKEMAVFGFGRQQRSIWARTLARLGLGWEDRILLNKTPAFLIIGFVESTDLEIVQAHLRRIRYP